MRLRAGVLGLVVLMGLTFTSGCLPFDAVSLAADYEHYNFGDRETIKGSGNIIFESYPFSNFDRVHIETAFRAEITRSDTFSVALEVDDNLLQYIDVYLQNDTLYVEFAGDDDVNFEDATWIMHIARPQISTLDVHVASSVELFDFVGQGNVNLDISSASRVSGHLEAQSLNVDLSGASNVDLTGSADRLDVEASGASSALLDSFTAVTADVNASGVSTALVHVTGRLDAEATGISTIVYSGSPELGDIEVGFGSSIVHKD